MLRTIGHFMPCAAVSRDVGMNCEGEGTRSQAFVDYKIYKDNLVKMFPLVVQMFLLLRF